MYLSAYDKQGPIFMCVRNIIIYNLGKMIIHIDKKKAQMQTIYMINNLERWCSGKKDQLMMDMN